MFSLLNIMCTSSWSHWSSSCQHGMSKEDDFQNGTDPQLDLWHMGPLHLKSSCSPHSALVFHHQGYNVFMSQAAGHITTTILTLVVLFWNLQDKSSFSTHTLCSHSDQRNQRKPIHMLWNNQSLKSCNMVVQWWSEFAEITYLPIICTEAVVQPV